MGKQVVAATPGGEKVVWETFLGKLFIIEPLEVEKDIKTVHGESDAVRANAWVVTGKGEFESFEDTLIFPKVLQSQTRRKIGSYVVGRLEQGEAKKGQNAPWQLAAPTDKDLKTAAKLLATVSVGGADDSDDDSDAF